MSEEEGLREWLMDDEVISRPYRIRRLSKLLEVMPVPEDGFPLHDGIAAPYVFNELRLAYVNGLFLSVVLLVLALIEREVAALLFGIGWNDAAKASLEVLLKEALRNRIITDSELSTINHLRHVRNSYAHFRELRHATSLIRRSIDQNVNVEEMLEADATEALSIAARFLGFTRS